MRSPIVRHLKHEAFSPDKPAGYLLKLICFMKYIILKNNIKLSNYIVLSIFKP